MYISTYIDSIIAQLNFTHDYIEAFIDEDEQNELNIKLQDVTADTVVSFLNIGVYVDNLTPALRIESQDYNLVFRIFEKQSELDDDSNTIDADIMTPLEIKANQIKYLIVSSSAYQKVPNQIKGQTFPNRLFKSEYDNIVAGIEFTMPVKLFLDVPFCGA